MHTDISWAKVLGPEKQQAYFQKTLAYINAERARVKIIYPPKNNTFNALRYTPLSEVKVVLLGRDPYHDPDQAHGLCFSVPKGVMPPPSLQNMFKELATNTVPGFRYPQAMAIFAAGPVRRAAAQYCAQCRALSATLPCPYRLGTIHR